MSAQTLVIKVNDEEFQSPSRSSTDRQFSGSSGPCEAALLGQMLTTETNLLSIFTS